MKAILFLIITFLNLTGVSYLPGVSSSRDKTIPLQIYDGPLFLIQQEKVVGQIFIPPRAMDAKTYQEYWYLSKDYVYPGVSTKADLLIQPAPDLEYQSLEEFRQAMREMFPDGKMITVTAEEE